jgi:hypothetical protein
MNWPSWLRLPRRRTLDNMIQTSVTMKYSAARWSTQRIALDGIQNHLPGDAKGTRTDIEFEVDGQWVPRDTYTAGDISAIRFTDDGKGYDSALLGVFHSTKEDNPEAVGYFGEGIKMLSAACLREDIDLELRSRDWSAKPVATTLKVDGEKIRRLDYSVTAKERINGSQTIFRSPTPQLIDYVKHMDRKVLLLRKDFRPIYTQGKQQVIDSEGDVFVKGVFISDTFKDRLMFSYGLDVIPNRQGRHPGICHHERNRRSLDSVQRCGRDRQAHRCRAE